MEMKTFFDQFERLFGLRIDHIFPLIIAFVAVMFFLNLKHQISALSAEVGDLRAAQNSVSSLGRSDIVPIITAVNHTNDQVTRLAAQSQMIADRLPEIENQVSLSNQKLTYLVNEKVPQPAGQHP